MEPYNDYEDLFEENEEMGGIEEETDIVYIEESRQSVSQIKEIDLTPNFINGYLIKDLPPLDVVKISTNVEKGTSVLVRNYEVSPTEFFKKQLEDILEKVPNINNTKLHLLSYIHHYGQGYKQKVLEDGICTSMESINNFESSLRKMNLLHGYWPDAHLNPDIKLESKNAMILSFYKISE